MGPIGAGAADQREFEITLGRRRMAALELGGPRGWDITPSEALPCGRDRTQPIVAEKLRSNPLEPGWRANIAVLPLVAVRAAASVAPAWRVVDSRTLGRRAGAFILAQSRGDERRKGKCARSRWPRRTRSSTAPSPPPRGAKPMPWLPWCSMPHICLGRALL